MKTLYIILIIIASAILIGVLSYESSDSSNAPVEINHLEAPIINYDCNVDSDCEVVDKGNCCGHYPVCANKNSKPNPDFVQAECEKKGIGSVCGYPVINECRCIENRCKDVYDRGDLRELQQKQ